MTWRKFGKVLLICGAGSLILVCLLMLAVKLALDRAPRYQAEIKDWVHAQTGFYVAFRHVSPAFRWYGPELYFDQLELRSKDGRRVLARSRGGRIGADVWQFLRSGKLLAGRIELDSPTLVIARTGPSSFELASEIGIELGGRGSTLASPTLDDLPAGKFSIRHGFLTITNWNAALPQLALRDMSLDLSRGTSGVKLVTAAQLPVELGGVLTVEGTARGSGTLSTLAWNIAAHSKGISFPGWRELLPEYLSRLDAGTGEFTMAAHGTGRWLARADLDFAAREVVTQLADGPRAEFGQISGAVSLAHSGDQWSLRGRHVRASLGAHLDPDSEFEITWRAGGLGLSELRAQANYLRVEALLPLTGLLPQKEIRDRLRDLALTGEWTNTRIDLSRGAADDPWRLRIEASFHGFGFAPLGRAPGLRGLSGTIEGSESGGRVVIDAPAAVFSWPNQFPHPLELQTLRTTLYWKRTADDLLVATPKFELQTHDAAAHGIFSWDQAEGASPVLTMAGVVENGNAANTRNYLPREFIAPPALTWLNRAFVAGHLSRADVVIQGPIRHFPFRDGSGLFLARANLEGMNLDYREGWPALANLSAVAEFRNEGLNMHLLGGRIGSITLGTADAKFADFKTGELEVHATGAGDAADALDFLRATPLDALAENAFSSVEAKGPLRSEIALFLPFRQFDQRRILVELHLNGVAVNRLGSTITASELSGDAEVEGAQVARADIHGSLLGGPVQVTARAPRNRPATRTQLDFRGTASGDALHEALSLPPSIPLTGQTDWHAVLRMAPDPARERSLRITSTLAGIGLTLPDPLAKASAAVWPSWVEVQWPVSGAPQVHLSIGSVLRGAFTLDSDAGGSRLGHLALTFGAGEPVASDGPAVNVGGSLERVDLAGWLKLAPDKGAQPFSSFLRPAKIAVAQLDYLGLSFFDVALDLNANSTGLHVAVTGPNVTGTLSIPNASEAGEPWNLQFERLRFVDEASDSEGAPHGMAMQGIGPHGVPAINFHAAELTWGERQLGDVRASLTKLNDGIGLKDLTVINPTFTASATGEWRGKDAGAGRIQGAASSTDVGETLKELGYAEVIDARTGRMDFDLNWTGAPTQESLSQVVGHVQLALDKGQIVGLKPGAGRVLGLASVAALPRRLALDFSDLTDKGFAFDTARGDFDLREGSAFTDNVLVKGPAAEIGVIGRVGLKSKDYDQTAVVTGSLGSSPLPLAGFVGGPVVGAAFLVFSQVFKQPLKGLARAYYRITGSWDNPTVERIKNADAAGAAVEAPK